MKRFMSVFIKGLLRYPRHGLLVSCLAIFFLGWLFLPATSLLSHSVYAARPNTPQNTPTPFLYAGQLERLLTGNGSRSGDSLARSGQSSFQARNTPRFSPFQILRQNQRPLSQTQESPTSTVAAPVQELSAGVTGIKSIVGHTSASIGEHLRFRIELTNNANDKALNLEVTDGFPSELTITQVSTTQNRGQVDIDLANNLVTVFFNSIEPHQTYVITINAVVNNTAVGNIRHTNIAYFSYYYINPPNIEGVTNGVDYWINTGLITLTPGGQGAVLVGQKTVSGSPATAGDPLLFRIEIINVGESPAYNIVVTDLFPSFLTITNVNVSTNINPTQRSVQINQNTVQVTVERLLVNQWVRIDISTIVEQGVTGSGSFSNVAFYSYNNSNQTYSTNTIIFQIGTTSSTSGGLPPTGGKEINISHRAVNPPPAVGALALLFGFALHLKRPWKLFNHPRGGSWIRAASSVLIIFGICFSLVACAQGDSRVDDEGAPASLATSNLSQTTPDVPTETRPIQTSTSATATPQGLPDYPIPTPALVTGNEEISFDISPIQRIVISSIDLDTIVKYVPYDGLSWKIAGLNTEVVWMGDTSWPGLGGNTGLSAHLSLPDGSDGPFRHLSELKEGDIVELYTVENKYIYSVRSQEVVSESDLSVLQSTDQSQITLITCTDWNEAMDSYLNRLIVYSDLVDIQPVGQPKSSQ